MRDHLKMEAGYPSQTKPLPHSSVGTRNIVRVKEEEVEVLISVLVP